MVTKVKSKASGVNSQLQIRVYDAERQLLQQPVELIVSDGAHNQLFRRTVKTGEHTLAVTPQDNWVDRYTVLATSRGFDLQGLFPVKVSKDFRALADIMLLPQHPKFRFYDWTNFQAQAPKAASLLTAGARSDVAAQEYDELVSKEPEVLSCFLNITTAMDQILFTTGTALDRLVAVNWDAPNAEDRFFAWAQLDLLNDVRKAASTGRFVEEKGSEIFHPGATCSYKEKDFGEANVQITFHENDKKNIGGVVCSEVELDIDYYDDALAHALMEVAVNKLTQRLTDPRQVYVLRWMAGRQAGRMEFEPPYSIRS